MFQFEVWLTLEFVCCPGLGLYLSSHESGVPTSSQINGDWSSGQTAIMFLCTFWCAAYTRAKACCLPVVTADDSASVMQWWPAILEDETSRRRDDGIFHVLDGRLGLSLNLYPHASAGDRIFSNMSFGRPASELRPWHSVTRVKSVRLASRMHSITRSTDEGPANLRCPHINLSGRHIKLYRITRKRERSLISRKSHFHSDAHNLTETRSILRCFETSNPLISIRSLTLSSFSTWDALREGPVE